MKKIFGLIFATSLFAFSSCDDDLEYDDFNTLENFNFLWKEIDEKYCFFDYKKDSIKRWDLVYDEYYSKVYYDVTNVTEYFDVLAAMLNELKDGHVNLYSGFDVSRYDFDANMPIDYDYNVMAYQDRYLAKDLRIASGLRYKTMRDGNVGYIRYSDFSSGFSDSQLNFILGDYFDKTRGLIIDVRSNGGGSISNVNMLVSHFIKEETIIGYRVNKTGPGHSDFSAPVAEKVSPVKDGYIYTKPVYILTNRSCYSATNEFVYSMKWLPQVTILGGKTGGGCGMPFTTELPCGWKVRFSANPCYDKYMNLTEFGVEPDIEVHLDEELAYKEKLDNIIETACDYIEGKY